METPLLPADWNPVAAANEVLSRLIRVTPSIAQGAHDAEFVCVGDYAYIVEHDNDVAPGHGEWEHQYCILSIVHLPTLTLEATIPLGRSEETIGEVTLPKGSIFVPRIFQIDSNTLRCYFAAQPKDSTQQSQTWFRDFDLTTRCFENRLRPAKLKTSAGTLLMQPQVFHDDAVLHGFKKGSCHFGLYIFDSFKEFDGKIYVALNNWEAKQNALAILLDDRETFEIVGHYNEPQSEAMSESAVNRLPDGTWLAICRNDKGNTLFVESPDGRNWTEGKEIPWVQNGENSKPTFDRFGGVYYLGWQDKETVDGCWRSIFNLDVSRDGKHWERKYRFATNQSFQYPTFHEHQGKIWLTVTQTNHQGSTDRIMFGLLEESN